MSKACHVKSPGVQTYKNLYFLALQWSRSRPLSDRVRWHQTPMAPDADGNISQSTHGRFDRDHQSLVRGSAWSCFARTPARPEDGSRHTDIHRAPGKKRSGGSRCVLSFCKSVRSCRRRGRKSLFGAMSHHTHGRGKSLEEKGVMGRAWGTGEGLRRKSWMVVCGRMLLMGAVTRSNPSSSRLERIEGIELRRR